MRLQLRVPAADGLRANQLSFDQLVMARFRENRVERAALCGAVRASPGEEEHLVAGSAVHGLIEAVGQLPPLPDIASAMVLVSSPVLMGSSCDLYTFPSGVVMTMALATCAGEG